jgi:hypothetical protein
MAPVLTKHLDVVGRGGIATAAVRIAHRVLAKHLDVVGRGFTPENSYHLWRHSLARGARRAIQLIAAFGIKVRFFLDLRLGLLA